MAVTIAREAASLARHASCPLCGTAAEVNIIALPGIRIDLAERRAWIAGREITLTRKEFEVLTYFAERPGQVVTKRQLYNDIWGHQELPGTTRTIDSHMSRLRRKIEHASGGVRLFGSVWGVGWRLKAA